MAVLTHTLIWKPNTFHHAVYTTELSPPAAKAWHGQVQHLHTFLFTAQVATWLEGNFITTEHAQKNADVAILMESLLSTTKCTCTITMQFKNESIQHEQYYEHNRNLQQYYLTV